MFKADFILKELRKKLRFKD